MGGNQAVSLGPWAFGALAQENSSEIDLSLLQQLSAKVLKLYEKCVTSVNKSLMPTQHINLAQSIFGLSGLLLGFLGTAKTVDQIWGDFKKAKKEGEYPVNHSFDNIVLALDFLYSIGAINNKDRKIVRTNETT